MSGGFISATTWNTTRGTLNTLITDCNAVIQTTYATSITPVITLMSGEATVSRTVSGPPAADDIRAAHYSDADGIVTKYNWLRNYDSCRYRDAGTATVVGTWHYNKTVASANLLGRRDASFPANTPAYITPPVVGNNIADIVSGRDILSIISDGATVHRSTILGVAAGSEYVVIDNCHTSCHSSCHSVCHSSCNRSRR